MRVCYYYYYCLNKYLKELHALKVGEWVFFFLVFGFEIIFEDLQDIYKLQQKTNYIYKLQISILQSVIQNIERTSETFFFLFFWFGISTEDNILLETIFV
eukprot:TRINITY_DN4691_c0_g1_i3.p4 TRINITY_DN4691_c0_g1~~TRINITY_DN4691_c0_g1_i3.p4  ORF type:complete len:100 (-),score=9.17 TRINITY_DN4691_c0_g1_i3:102-401(-)